MPAIDHFYVLTEPGAAIRERLVAHGLLPGLERDHPGQGTRNVCFSFADSYLELLWIDDEDAAASEPSRALQLPERSRWRTTGASPFGICLRGPQPAPFEHWHYRPDYLPAGMSIAIADASRAPSQPMLFQIERTFEPFGPPHACSRHRVQQLEVVCPGLPDDSPLRSLHVPGLAITKGDAPRMTVMLRDADGGTTGQQLDLRPELPLVLHW